MKARVHSSGRDLQDFRDFRSPQADVVGQYEHGPMVDGQLKKGPFELIAIGESGDVVGIDRAIDVEDEHLWRTSTLRADVIAASADQDPMEPPIEALGFAQPGQIAPSADERFLDDVFRCIPIAEDAPRDRVQAVVCVAGDGIKCLAIASLCALDQARRHRRTPGIGAGISHAR